MKYLFITLWAAFDICFAWLFLSAFFETKRTKRDIPLLCIAAWMVYSLFCAFIFVGLYRYLIYLFVVVFILLGVFEEYGTKGLSLLFFTFLLPFAVDKIIMSAVSDAEVPLYYMLQSLGRAMMVLFAYLLLKYRCSAQKSISEESEALLLRQHMEMQQESMNALEQNYRLQRKSTHEFEHHLQVLHDLLNQEELEAAKDYLNRLKKNRSIHTISVSSGHPVVDVILNQKYQSAVQNEIKMQIQVNNLSSIQIPSDVLVVVLTNLLDNAIEACRRINGYREIFCTILYDEGVYLSIRNTSLPVTVIDGKIPTSKQNSLSHGFGLLSVGHVLDELEAEYTFGQEEGWFYFTAEIPC